MEEIKMFETYILPVLMFAVMGLVAGILLTVATAAAPIMPRR